MDASVMTTELVKSKTVETDALILQGTTITDVTDPTKTTQPTHAAVLYNFLEMYTASLKQKLDSIDINRTNLKDYAVVSLPLNDCWFRDPLTWQVVNWSISGNKAYCIGGYPDNRLKINNNSYIAVGKYMALITVESIGSGYLEVYTKHLDVDTYIGRIEQVGTYCFEFTIEDTGFDWFYLKGVGVEVNTSICVRQFSVSYIADRFDTYLTNRIRALASVDATEYMRRDELDHQISTILEQTNAVIHGYSDVVNDHISNPKAHGEYASIVHEHDNYTTRDIVNGLVDAKLVDYSPSNHTHQNYLSIEQAKPIMTYLVDNYMATLSAISPNIIMDAPTGILPQQFVPTDVTKPLSILLSSYPYHNASTPYDLHSGYITCQSNFDRPSHIFARDGSVYKFTRGQFSTAGFISFKIQFHHQVTVRKYKLRFDTILPTAWLVYSGNTNLIHRETRTETIEDEPDGYKSMTLYFNEDRVVESLIFVFTEFSSSIPQNSDDDNILLNIRLDFVDTTTDSFSITEKPFTFSSADTGISHVRTREATPTPVVITPTVRIHDLPLYVFMHKYQDENYFTTSTSYFPLECSNIRQGTTPLINNYERSMLDRSSDDEKYTHLYFGSLTLLRGVTGDGYDLTDIYNDTNYHSWRTDGTTDTVILEQTIDQDDVVFMSYLLSWRLEDRDCIPDQWSVTVYGKDVHGTPITMVADSVSEYYPFYSYEDDDIVYQCTFKQPIIVNKIVIEFSSKSGSRVLSIGKMFLYLSQWWYSIPTNTSYKGLQPVEQICLGSCVYKNATIGWQAHNPALGRSVVVPVNNLSPCQGYTTYQVTNPFHSVDVLANINHYKLKDMDVNPDAYISEITAEHITVQTLQGGCIYAVAIARTW